MRNFKTILTLFLTLTILVSCQEPQSELELPDAEEGFTPSTTLGQYIKQISLLDGSNDNILDNASCLQIVLPVDITLNSALITIESANDLENLVEQYNSNPMEFGTPQIAFPITVKKSDYSEETVTSQQQLNLMAALCAEGGQDDDIECIDFNYPISIATYDLQNQQAKTWEIQDDQSLLNLIGGLNPDDLISLSFPISMTHQGGNEAVENHIQLQQLIENEGDECDEDDRTYEFEGEIPFGTLIISITDAPFPIDQIAEANITITGIDVKTGEGVMGGPFITVFNETVTYNLIELTNGVTIQLVHAQIPAGTYESFRIYADSGQVVLTDGQVFDLKIPSGSSSGIKVLPDTPVVVSAGATSEYLFDFDLSRSFIPKGNPNDPSKINGFNFKPVLRVSNVAESGILTGSVQDINTMNPLEGVQITLMAGDTINTIAFTGADGSYTILGLTPGLYDIEAEATDYQIYNAEDVEIIKNVTTEHHVMLEQ